MNVKINGDLDGFVDKNNMTVMLNEIKNNTSKFKLSNYTKYIKSDYKFEVVEKTNTKLRLKLVKVNNEIDLVKREELRKKIKNMSKTRTNMGYHMAMKSDVPDDILTEYKKLSKMSNLPIPEPQEVLKNPDTYKPMISMILSNKMMDTLPQSHPYLRYFKLLANKIGAKAITLPENLSENLSNNLLKPIVNENSTNDVKGNDIKNVETDSDTEESDEEKVN